MKKFEGKNLEEVYELARKEFSCSITDLEIEVLQQASKGFLGFGKKNAIIEVSLKKSVHNDYSNRKNKSFRNRNLKIEEVSTRVEKSNKQDRKYKKDYKKPVPLNEVPKDTSKEKIFDNFYNEDKSIRDVSKIIIKKDQEEILEEIKNSISLLFNDTCYEIDDIKVEFYDEDTIYMEFSGKDSALLIGKEGYRYKALSYILFNWINEKYGLMLRLEVAQFLRNQEEAVNSYLIPVIETIKEKGSFKTKPLDGILVHIALSRLRKEFPNKYVAVKTNIKGDRYILVNEYRQKEK